MKKPESAPAPANKSGPAPAKQRARAPAELGRRAFLRTIGGGATLVAAAGPLTGEARALPTSYQNRRKSDYQANSPEVQDFYRVNSYPPKSGNK